MDAADNTLMVRFYKKEVELPYRSEQEGRTVHQMMDFVRIEVPGDRLNVIDTIADRGHKKRFPQQWAAFEAEQNTDHIEGTLLTQVPFLTSAAAMDLRHFKFYTVEQAAAASDAQLANIGASLGMSGFAFRDKCRAYIEHAKDSSLAVRQAEAHPQAATRKWRCCRQQVADLHRQGPQARCPNRSAARVARAKQEATA
jgi:hypothetical protein